MKCVDVEKQIDLLIDNELNPLKRIEIEHHLDECSACQKSYQSLRTTKEILNKQSEILPTAFLDRQILQAFEKHHQPKEITKRSFWQQFFIPRPAFALILTLFAVGLGLAFLLGRLSVPENAKTEQLTQQPTIKTEIVEKEVEKIVPQVVTKIVKIPIIKTKIVNRETKNLTSVPQTNEREAKNIAGNNSSDFNQIIQTRLNLENFRPVANIEIKVIKKGETNE